MRLLVITAACLTLSISVWADATRDLYAAIKNDNIPAIEKALLPYLTR